MTHEEDKYLQHKMDGARLKDVFPEFDKEGEWLHVQTKMKPKAIPGYTWAKVAAVVLIMVGCGSYLWVRTNGGEKVADNPAEVVNVVQETKNTIKESVDTIPTIPNTIAKQTTVKSTQISNKSTQKIAYNALAAGTYGKSTEAICNATDCAIEICIAQTVRCKDKPAAEVADCRTLEPDQAGPLKYTEPEKYGCSVTVDEIRIKKVSTGETIVINSTTQPASAEEMLQCFTGRKKCGMTAGFFNADCNNIISPSELTVDNHYGDVIIQ